MWQYLAEGQGLKRFILYSSPLLRKRLPHFQTRIAYAWIANILASAAGLLMAYYLDFSVGPPIALCLGILLALVGLAAKISM